MKYKTLRKTEREYNSLLHQVLSVHPNSENGGYLGTQIVAVTGDFEPTQTLADARWLAAGNYYGYSLTMIDGVGDMITIIPE